MNLKPTTIIPLDGFLAKFQSDSYLSSRNKVLSEGFFTTHSFEKGNLPDPYVLSTLNNDFLNIEEVLKTTETVKYSLSAEAFERAESEGERIHVKNYDTNLNRDCSIVKHWVTSLFAEDLQQLGTLAEITKENKEREFKISSEFEVGLDVTSFIDIITDRINYNVTIDNFYCFFCINVPLNFSEFPVNTIKK